MINNFNDFSDYNDITAPLDKLITLHYVNVNNAIKRLLRKRFL